MFLIDQEEEEKFKRTLEYYFNITDTDHNGVITFPEFIKMSMDFCGNEESGKEDMVRYHQLPS